MLGPTLSRSRLEVFAVEDTAAQVCWATLRPGTRVTVAGTTHEVSSEEPAAVVFEGLQPGTAHTVFVDGAPGPRFRTLHPPPGEELCRFSTVNDLHIGERRFGLLRTMTEGAPAGAVDTYALRCARAACAEAVAWGGDALVAKGDLTWVGRLLQFDAVGQVLTAWGGPTLAVLGNHDVAHGSVDGRAALRRQGLDIPHQPFAFDLPGMRIVLAHSAIPEESFGGIDGQQRDQIRQLLTERQTPAYLGMHHYPQRFKQALMYPPGIPGPQAAALLDMVAAANPATLVAAGHSHRNRRHRHGPLVVTEIGATHHYPGTWAGYAVHEGGIRQVVRRVAAPDAIAWTEYSRRALGGLWGRWSPGLLRHRCFTHTWPR